MSQQNERCKWDQIVEEEAPHMRSVAMVSLVPRNNLQQTSPFTFKTANDVGGGVVGVEGKTKQQPYYSVQLDVKPATIKSWNVTSVMSIPPYYQLDRTHVMISNDVSLNEVVIRLMDIFHSESIAVVYDDHEAKAICETKDCIKFVVRLWKSASNQIVVECQRCAGCCYVFCKKAKKVLKAARDGKNASSSSDKKNSSLSKKTVPSAVRGCIPNIPEEEMKSSVEDCLQIACEMINSGHLDAQQLSIESLLHVADSYKTQAFCAMMILTNEVLLTALYSLVVFCNLDQNHPNFSSDLEKDCFSVMRRHALTVLAYCFATLDGSMAFDSVISDNSMLVDDNFLKTLVLFVASGATKPHEAADACKCLQMLCLHSNSIKQRVADFGTSFYLKHAQDCRHATLHDASKNLLVALSS